MSPWPPWLRLCCSDLIALRHRNRRCLNLLAVFARDTEHHVTLEVTGVTGVVRQGMNSFTWQWHWHTCTKQCQAVPSKFDQGRSQTTEKHESRVIELSHGNNSAYFCRAPEAIDTLCTVRCLRGYSPPLTPWCRATCLARNGVAFSRWQHLACLQACIFRGVRPKPACYKQDS